MSDADTPDDAERDRGTETRPEEGLDESDVVDGVEPDEVEELDPEAPGRSVFERDRDANEPMEPG